MTIRGRGLAILVIFGAAVLALRFFTTAADADTITLKDGSAVKGIVVEEYIDRVVISTENGETTVMKARIERLDYDSEVANLIKLAEQALAKGDQARAYRQYEKALAIDPGSKAAKDGLAYLEGYKLRMLEAAKLAEIKRREAADRFGSVAVAGAMEAAKQKAQLEKSTGMTLRIMDDLPRVEKVVANSPAYNAGVRAGDDLVAIWGKLAGYMSSDEVLAALLNRSGLEIRCTIERTIDIPVRTTSSLLAGSDDLIGASLVMTRDGMAVSGVIAPDSGLRKGDRVVAIDGTSTRYMPLKSAIARIKDHAGEDVALTLRRTVTIWRADRR